MLNKLRGTCSMMVVEHDMEFVAALPGDAGKVTVMAEGSVLAHGTLEEVKRMSGDRVVLGAMSGANASNGDKHLKDTNTC